MMVSRQYNADGGAGEYTTYLRRNRHHPTRPIDGGAGLTACPGQFNLILMTRPIPGSSSASNTAADVQTMQTTVQGPATARHHSGGEPAAHVALRRKPLASRRCTLSEIGMSHVAHNTYILSAIFAAAPLLGRTTVLWRHQRWFVEHAPRNLKIGLGRLWPFNILGPPCRAATVHISGL